MIINNVILDVLYENIGKYITSDVVCQRLNISRIAVWNRIKGLKKFGYNIESKRSVGYRLVEEGKNILIPYEIKRHLNTKTFGGYIEYYRLTSSTMDESKYLIEKGCQNGTIVISEEQTNGRGRGGKKWISPKGDNLYVSLIYMPENISYMNAINIMFAASIAIVEVLSDFGIENAKIKWPNDVTVNDKKIAGVLLETKSESGILSSAVIGFGINVNLESIPKEIDQAATSMKIETGENIDRTILLTNMIYYFENLISMIEEGKQSRILDIWKQYNNTLGRNVEIISDNESIKGLAKDIDDKGFLLVETKDGIKRVVTSDSLRFL